MDMIYEVDCNLYMFVSLSFKYKYQPILLATATIHKSVKYTLLRDRWFLETVEI